MHFFEEMRNDPTNKGYKQEKKQPNFTARLPIFCL